MGEFARQVKNGTMHGPHTRKFKREDWEAMHGERIPTSTTSGSLVQVSFSMIF